MVSLPIICIIRVSMAQQRKGMCDKEHHTRHLITSQRPTTGGPWAQIHSFYYLSIQKTEVEVQAPVNYRS